ncbi:hypothetical protein GCM10009555_078570 [Acrocarpospora macrocephala]|uniref:Uncharacterized protein n=1 Tax=Acrocarpospora macrocephala TaxID=150177 RepID=A0A5M3XDW3_9ACTN|nr:hypothetical protein Amac_098560 [Acrocarpospora macrocephala]
MGVGRYPFGDQGPGGVAEGVVGGGVRDATSGVLRPGRDGERMATPGSVRLRRTGRKRPSRYQLELDWHEPGK